MSRKNIFLVFVLIMAIGVLLACATVRSGYVPPLQHPDAEGEDLRYCTDCHDAEDEQFPYRRFMHTDIFSSDHRQAVNQSREVCNMCHGQSFCNDCHGVWVELKPSIKNQTSNTRMMPHRGDYLTRHRIDGRINPTSCFRCHGNPATAQKCKPCHG